MAFVQYWSYLLGQVSELSAPHAKLLVNQAWSDIRQEKTDWSFLTREIVITVPDAISAGTVTVTQDSDTVTTDATAKAALDLVAAALPGRVLRAGGAGGPMYNISAYDIGTGNITLDRVYYEISAALIGYLIYAPYVKPPSSDFERFTIMRDPVAGYSLGVDFTRAEIDRRDPLRGATGNPLVLAAKTDDATGLPTYELWPHPIVRRAYPTLYQAKGLDLSDSVDLPFVITKELIQERALYRVYEWAEANKGRHETLQGGPQGTDWRFLMQQAEKRYAVLLNKIKRKDDEIFNAQWGESYLSGASGIPIDAKYFQTHAPWSAGSSWPN